MAPSTTRSNKAIAKGAKWAERRRGTAKGRFGYEALCSQDDIPPAAVQAAHGHHERLDGRGYPQGLDGYQIPFITRVVTIVDAFDGLGREQEPRSVELGQSCRIVENGSQVRDASKIGRAWCRERV